MSPLKRAQELEMLPWSKIVTVGLVSGNEILTGKRRDNGLWTSPGGHMDADETIYQAAIREVREESGIEVDIRDLDLIGAERYISHRNGLPFVVFGFVARVDKAKATAKDDPDKEISQWKWVELSRHTPELKAEARHAKEDMVLQHLGVWTGMRMAGKLGDDPRDQGRTIKEVSDDMTEAGKSPSPPQEPERPAPPEPKALTPEELKQDPEELLKDDSVTGD